MRHRSVTAIASCHIPFTFDSFLFALPVIGGELPPEPQANRFHQSLVEDSLIDPLRKGKLDGPGGCGPDIERNSHEPV